MNCKFQKDIFYNIYSLKNKYPDNLSNDAWAIAEKFTEFIANKNFEDVTIRHSKTHPCTILYFNKSIFTLTKYKAGRTLEVRIVSRHLKSVNRDTFKIHELQIGNLGTSFYQDNYGFIFRFEVLNIETIKALFTACLEHYKEVMP